MGLDYVQRDQKVEIINAGEFLPKEQCDYVIEPDPREKENG